jgi:TPR repeat protein
MYKDGKGVAVDYKESCNWFLKSAINWLVGTQDSLPLIYGDEQNSVLDKIEIYKWMLIAIAQGYSDTNGVAKCIRQSMSDKEIDEAKRQAEWYVFKENNLH